MTSILHQLKHSDHWPQAIFYLLFSYVSLVPYYYLQEQSLTQGIPQLPVLKYLPFILSCGLYIGAFLEIMRNRDTWRYSPISPFIAIYLSISLLSLIGAEYAFVGLAKWVYYHATGSGLCLLVIHYCRTWKQVKDLAAWISIVSSFVVIYTVMIALLGYDPVWGAIQQEYNPYYTADRVAGPFGHTVATASYTMMLFPLALWSFRRSKRLSRQLMWGICCALFIPVVLLTQTRGAQLSAILCCAVLLPWLRSLHSNRVLRRQVLVSATGCILAILIFFIWKPAQLHFFDTLQSDIYQRWHELLSPQQVVVQNDSGVYHYGSTLVYTERFRIAQYESVQRHLAEHPFLGVGFGVYTRIFERDKFEQHSSEIWTVNAHTTENMYLLFLVETGCLGFLSRFTLVVIILVYITRHYRHIEKGEAKWLLLAILAGQVGLDFNMLTWDILNEPTMRIASWLLVGLAFATVRTNRES